MRYLLLLLMFLVANAVHAQDGTGAGQLMQSHGKIYVVVAVLTAIFLGIILYLIRIDRKLTKLEKDSRINHN